MPLAEPTGRPARAARIPLLAMALILALGACTALGSRGTEPYATLVVHNDATVTVNVYAVRAGSRIRIGTVTSLRSAEFPLRLRMLSGANELQLLIDPIGSRREYPAQSIIVDEDSVIELQVSSFIR